MEQDIPLLAAAHPIDAARGIIGELFNSIVLTLVTLLIGFIIGKIAGRFLAVILRELEFLRPVSRALGLRFYLEDTVGNIVSYIIYLFTILLALNNLGLAAEVTTTFSAVIIIMLVLYFIVGVRDNVSNTVAGLRIMRKPFMKLGRRVRVGNVEGVIMQTTLTNTVVKTPAGDMLYIPNRLLSDSIVTEVRGKNNEHSQR